MCMNCKKMLPRIGVFLLFFVVLISCQEDISTIGSEILGTESPNGILDDSQSILAYSKKLSPVQSNRLGIYQMGVFNDAVFGKSNINFLSQLKMELNNPKFGIDARADSVFVYIPYFSKGTTEDSVTTYTLDSIYGNSPINIIISESGYFLRDLDPDSGFQETQPYYSNQGSLFSSYVREDLATVENFIPNTKSYVLRKGEKDEEKLAPGLRIALPTAFFQDRIIRKEGSQELLNNNNFKNYLRGLYFQVNSDNNGNLFLFDASKAYVAIHYSYKEEDSSTERTYKKFKLNFGDVSVNTFNNQPLPDYMQADLDNPNIESGNNNLYLRGGDGIISVVELFGKDADNNGVSDELELLRSKKWLINEANLIFYVNQDLMSGSNSEPERIKIYDLKNNTILADYNMDPTNGLPPYAAIKNHLGILERGSDGKGKYYKLKITNHISNLINKDSTNVPLGIVVSQNVTSNAYQKLLEPMEPNITKVPAGDVVSHEGTILYGNAASNPEKKLKLQIYYTKRE